MIDGVFIAYEKDCPDATSARPDYTAFPHSKARAAIAAVDSSWFEVYTKEAAIIAQLKASFVEVREEDPQLFFMA